METMKNALKSARLEKKLTQEELSEKSGVSRTTIALLESNAPKVTNSGTLLKLAKALDMPVSNLFFLDK